LGVFLRSCLEEAQHAGARHGLGLRKLLQRGNLAPESLQQRFLLGFGQASNQWVVLVHDEHRDRDLCGAANDEHLGWGLERMGRGTGVALFWWR
jgi:hypothetical protein